ncbi:MAG: TolC family protein [Burkholderiales bacterium]|nr:TolC family protein [Burkholderiales bacterium]
MKSFRSSTGMRLAATLMLASCAGALHAESLGLDRALELAERYSPRLQIALAQVERARSGIRTARAYPNPEFEILTGQVRARVPGLRSGQGTSISIGQTIDLPNQRTPRINAAEAGLEGSRYAHQEARLLLRADVKQAFYTVLRRRAEYELALDNQKLLEQIKNRIELRVKVGEGARFELVRAEAELSSAVNQSNSAKLRVTQALAQLRVLIGAPLPADTDVTGDLEAVTATDDLETLRKRVMERYPAVLQAQMNVKQAEQRLEAERALRTPRPTLFAGVDQDPEQRQGIFGVSVPIPLWDQRQGPIGESVALFQQATSQAELTRLEVTGDLEVNYNRLKVSAQQIAAFEGGLLKQAESALRVAEAAFRFGERGFIEVLDAQRVLRTVRADFLNARFEKQAAAIEIDRLTAKDLPGETK